jgi:hypothetical protein
MIGIRLTQRPATTGMAHTEADVSKALGIEPAVGSIIRDNAHACNVVLFDTVRGEGAQRI